MASDGILSEEFTAEEKAYFESRGDLPAANEARVMEENPTPAPAETPENVENTPENTENQAVSPPVSTPEEPSDTPLGTPEEPSSDDDKAGKVPVWALKEARERAREAQAQRKAIEDQLQAEREARVRLEERFMAMQRQVQPPAPQEEPLPDPEIDPLGYEAKRRENLEREVENLRSQIVATKMESEIGWINTQTQQLTYAFAAKNPDYENALEYVKERRREQLALLSPHASPAEIEESVTLEYGNIVRESLERLPNGALRFRRIPAETVYSLAKSMGYQKPSPEPVAAAPKETAPPPVVQEDPAERSRRRAAAATSLSSISGSEGSGPLDAKRLAQMSEAEFGKLVKEQPDLVARLMGA